MTLGEGRSTDKYSWRSPLWKPPPPKKREHEERDRATPLKRGNILFGGSSIAEEEILECGGRTTTGIFG